MTQIEPQIQLQAEITALKTILAKKEAELAAFHLSQVEKDVAAFKRTHPELECRTGHDTSSTNHRDWQSDNGETFTFVIVNTDCPRITHIGETSRHTWVHLEGQEHAEDHEDILLGSGQTEAEAWEDAALR